MFASWRSPDAIEVRAHTPPAPQPVPPLASVTLTPEERSQRINGCDDLINKLFDEVVRLSQDHSLVGMIPTAEVANPLEVMQHLPEAAKVNLGEIAPDLYSKLNI